MATVKSGNYVENQTIRGSGEDNNTEWAELIFLTGGDGNDVIYNVKSTSQSTIRGGSGNDTIYLEDGNGSYTTYINYAEGDGDDVIYGYNASYKINITDGTSYSTVESGDDIIIKIGSGQIKLANYTGSDNMAYAGRLINFDYNAIYDDEKSNIRIRATAGNDFIWVGGVNNTIYGGDGNDLPENNDSSNYFILGNGNNDMLNNGDSATIVTGDGNNRIGNNKSYARVTTGGGNDTIENHSGSENYFDAGGGDDFLDIIAPSRESSLSGDNLTVKGGGGNDTIASWGGWSDGNVINNNLYDGGAGNDYLGIANAQLSTIIGGTGDDTISLWNDAKSNMIQYAAGDGNDIINGFSNTDTFQITSGFISSSVYSGNDLILTISDSDSIGSVTITDVKDQDIAIKPTSNIEAEPAFEFNTAKTIATLNNNFEGTFDLADYSTVKTVVGSQNNNDLEILGNAKNNNLYGGRGHDNIDGKAGNDYLVGNEGDDTLNGGRGNDTLYGGNGSDLFIYNNGDGNDLILDYTSGTDTLNINNGTIKQASLSGSDVILTVGTGTITLKDAKGEKITIVDENDDSFDTIINDELVIFDEDESPVKLGEAYRSADASNRTIAIQITGNSKNNTIQGGAKADTLSGGAGNDSIVGNAGNDVLKGDGGNDTLNGGKGNDTLTGGAGKDVFVISAGAGNDVITDYTSGEDKIKISGGTLKSITTVSSSSKDIVFNFSSGKVTVKNAKGKEITYIDANGKTVTPLIPPATVPSSVTLGNDDSSVYTAKSGIGSIDAKKRTSAIKITGNAKDNTIYGGTKNDSIYGGNGNDSINGGAGNDKLFGDAGNDTLIGDKGNDTLTGGKGDDILTGGAGNDVFTYTTGDGNDTITDYAAGDVIRIKGSYSTTSSNGNVKIKAGTGSITVLNTTVKKLTITSQKSFNEELGIMNYELSTIMNTDSNLIGEDYKYDFNSNFTKQLKPEIKLTTNKK